MAIVGSSQGGPTIYNGPGRLRFLAAPIKQFGRSDKLIKVERQKAAETLIKI